MQAFLNLSIHPPESSQLPVSKRPRFYWNSDTRELYVPYIGGGSGKGTLYYYYNKIIRPEGSTPIGGYTLNLTGFVLSAYGDFTVGQTGNKGARHVVLYGGSVFYDPNGRELPTIPNATITTSVSNVTRFSRDTTYNYFIVTPSSVVIEGTQDPVRSDNDVLPPPDLLPLLIPSEIPIPSGSLNLSSSKGRERVTVNVRVD